MWRMTLAGIPEFLAYSLKYPGCSRFDLSCQGSELMIGLAKLFCRECGTGKWDMPNLLATYLDLTGTAMVANNMVRFESIIQKLEREKLLVFDPIKTPALEILIENHMAPLMKYIVEILDQWNPGDDIHPFLKQILNAMTLDVNSLNVQKLQSILNNSNGNVEDNAGNINVNSGEYDATLQEMYRLQKEFLSHKSMKAGLRVDKILSHDRV